MRVSFWLLPVLAMSLVACVGNGKDGASSEERDLPSFDRIVLKGVGKIHITQGDETAVEVQAAEEVLGSIKTEVQGSTLTIDTETLAAKVNAPTYNITVKQLSRVEIEGAGTVDNVGQLDVDTLSLRISGAGRAKLNLKGDSLVINVEGAGKVTAEGQVNAQTIQIAGVGRYDAANLKSQDALVRVSGAGIAAVNASKSLIVAISGGGKVYYAGSPHITQSISGAGSIEKLAIDDRDGAPKQPTNVQKKAGTPWSKKKTQSQGESNEKVQLVPADSKQAAQEKSASSRS